MNSEEHIHFLSELLYEVNQLLTLVKDYCNEVVQPDDETTWQMNSNDKENIPF